MRLASCLPTILLLAFAPALARAVPAPGARLEAGFVEKVLTDTLDSPISMAIAPDGRIFVCEQRGTLRVIRNDTLLAKPFVTLPVSTVDEEGLLSVAFDPAFATNGYLYVVHTVTSPVEHNRISRLTASGDTALAGSLLTLFELDDHFIHWHLGGALHVGPDGKLWASQGDDGSGNNSQDMSTTFGKMLRINTDGSIPTDNPFYGSTTGRRRAIWALGLRNPFTFAFQPGTGKLYINDVGQADWEEINEGVAGGNFAWPIWEGPGNYLPGYEEPVHVYPHTDGCAITGGTFYDPPAPTFPAAYVGKYFYAEYCENEIRMIDPAAPAAYTVFGQTIVAGPVDLRVGPDGSLYYLSRGNSNEGGGVGSSVGMVVRVSYTMDNSPTIAQHPAPQLATVGDSATFAVVAGGTPPLSYQWQRDAADIPGATASAYTTPPVVLADDGALFRCVVTNAFGSIASDPAPLSVTTNHAPVPVIATPVAGQHYDAGTLLSFSGSASDAEQGALPAAALTWRIDFHHNLHTHPAMPATSGIASGAWDLGTGGETSPDVWYRVFLEAADSLGRTGSTHVDVLPNLSQITLETSPPGLSLTLDGQPVTTPHTVTGVVGLYRTIGAPGPQSQGGRLYGFRSWSDQLLATHVIATPASPATWTATYALLPSDTAEVVNWSGDYVASDADLRGFSTPAQFNVPLAGGYNGARWHIPYSDASPLSPSASDGIGNSWRFYGGILMESYTNSFAYHWAEVRNLGALDQLQTSGPTGTRGWDLRYWKKADFTGGGSAGAVTFGPSSRLEIQAYSGGDGVPGNNSGFVRFVVRDGAQFYVSRDSAGPAAVETDFVLNDPGARLWAPYNPTAPYGIKFDLATASFGPHTFTDITAVGYLHSNDNVAPPATGKRCGFACMGVRALALLDAPTLSAPGPGPLAPGLLSLAPCTPNPATDASTLSFRLGTAGPVTLEVFDVAGQRVARLADGPLPAGEHRVAFDTRALPAGLYFVRLAAGDRTAWRKFTRLR